MRCSFTLEFYDCEKGLYKEKPKQFSTWLIDYCCLFVLGFFFLPLRIFQPYGCIFNWAVKFLIEQCYDFYNAKLPFKRSHVRTCCKIFTWYWAFGDVIEYIEYNCLNRIWTPHLEIMHKLHKFVGCWHFIDLKMANIKERKEFGNFIQYYYTVLVDFIQSRKLCGADESSRAVHIYY